MESGVFLHAPWQEYCYISHPMSHKKEMLRRGWGGRLGCGLAAALLSAACGAAGIQAPAARMDPAATSSQILDESAVPVRELSGESTFVQYLEKQGATHVTRARGYINDRVVSAVTADGLRHVYIFADGGYAGRLDIHCDKGREPLRPFLKIVYGKKRFGVLLVAHNLALDGKRISQLIFVEKGGKKTHVSLTMDALEKKHGGMTDPYVGGEDLASGVIFCAKNSKGKAWDTVFLITESSGTVKIEKMPRILAYDCPCFMDWVLGRSTQGILGMNP
jgi:hypothetical protein